MRFEARSKEANGFGSKDANSCRSQFLDALLDALLDGLLDGLLDALLFSLSQILGVKLVTFYVVVRTIWYHGAPSGVQVDFGVRNRRQKCTFLSNFKGVILIVLS